MTASSATSENRQFSVNAGRIDGRGEEQTEHHSGCTLCGTYETHNLVILLVEWSSLCTYTLYT